MSNIATFLSHLSDLDIHLRVQDDCLRFNAPKGALTPELSKKITARKPEILAFLSQPAKPKIRPVPRTGHLPLSFYKRSLLRNNFLRRCCTNSMS